MKILALDTATKTGFCMTGGISGVFEADLRRGESPGMRFLRFRAWLTETIQLAGIGKGDVIAFELAHHRGGAATQLCVGLTTEVLAAAAACGAETMPVHTATLKKWAAGNGRAGKPEMIERAKELGYKPIDDNHADACCLYEYAKKMLGATKNA